MCVCVQDPRLAHASSMRVRRRAGAPCTSSVTSKASEPLVPAITTCGTRAPASTCQEHRVRLVLDLLAPGREERRGRVAVRDPAPDPGHELRVGFVATDRDDTERVRRTRRRGTAHVRRVVPRRRERRRRGCRAPRAQRVHLVGRRTARRGSEHEVHERSDTPAEDERRDDVGGKRPPEVHRRDRQHQHDALADAAGRAGKVGRRDGNHRDRHRDPHQWEARNVGRVEDHGEGVRQVGLVHEDRDQTARTQASAPAVSTSRASRHRRTRRSAKATRASAHSASRS